MSKFIWIFNIANFAGLAVSIWLGYQAGAGPFEYELHLVVGLIVAVLAMMGLTVVIFYFLYSGALVKAAARDAALPKSYYMKTVGHKKKLFPLVMASIVLVMVTPILGAALDAEKLASSWHHYFAWSALALVGLCIYKIRLAMLENMGLLDAAIKALKQGSGSGTEEKKGDTIIP